MSLSSNVTKYCRKKGIRVVFYDATGKAYASLEGVETILPSVMEAQMSLSEDKTRRFIQALVTNKIKNQSKLLRYYLKYHHESETPREVLSEAIEGLDSCASTVIEGADIDEFRQNAMILEAQAAKSYWRAYGALVSNTGYSFERREQRGATDIVNQMLNYGYAILQSHVTHLYIISQ
ncbi:MAG: CRISPR-associated endonuclease Cas1 [Porphyromonas sp.]|nr:CRISPR-associated endonuclease Cas1 [Porphyromonas sp.]